MHVIVTKLKTIVACVDPSQGQQGAQDPRAPAAERIAAAASGVDRPRRGEARGPARPSETQGVAARDITNTDGGVCVL